MNLNSSSSFLQFILVFDNDEIDISTEIFLGNFELVNHD